MNYLKDQDLYGILFKGIVNQYIVVENNNLKEFASKVGVQNTDIIPDKIESTKITGYLNYEEIKPLISKYLNIAIEAIPEDNYSKVEKADILLGDKTIQADGYQMKLKSKDIQSIFVKVLESAKNDDQLFNLMSKFNKDITIEEYQESINDTLTELSGEISNEENVNFANITVYKQEKEAIKLSINFVQEEGVNKEISLNRTNKGLELRYSNKDTSYDSEDENSIIITKTTNTEEQENFEFNITEKSNGEKTGNYNFTLSRTGALTSDNVVFSILMPFNLEGGSINIEFKSITNFSATPQFEEFKEGNHLVINGVAPEQLSNLFTNLGVKISEKLQNEMFLSLISNFGTIMENTEMNNENIQDTIEEEDESLEQMGESFNETDGQRGSSIIPYTD